ncbi:membrane hypothetical protein [Candidatus Accumulibacter aalborgensis]|uniref:Uncharacterized protein n=2 Tax=Candidatus Accumulibacter aalborgensis TaxID=1860102 RepID=A0A1A8XV83_9PROT|nr:membrane hypothetical protein [Candidatus Accumulibacter aalborgensis]
MHGAVAVFNFCLYPLIFSYFYLLVPAFIPFVTSLDNSLALSANSFQVIDQLAAWSVSIFFLGYILSKERHIAFNQKLIFPAFSVSVSRIIQVITIIVSMVILIRHGPDLYSISGDRGISYEYYSTEILNAYRLPVVFSFSIISSTFLYLHHRNINYQLPILIFCILDALQGGRGYSFAAVTIIGLNYLALNMNKFKRTIGMVLIFVAALFLSAFIRRFMAVDETADPIVILLGEFFFTRLTAQITYDTFSSHGDLLTYLLLAMSKMLPQFIVAPLFSEAVLTPYHVLVNQWADAGFGLAGSVMAEAIYYGGVKFGIASPLIISAIFLTINRSTLILRLPGYLFFLVVTSSMYLIFRTGFYTNFFSIIYVFLFYYSIIIFPSRKKRVFLVTKKR